LLDTELLEYVINGETPNRRGNFSRQYAPHGVYRCAGADRWIAISVRNTEEWLSLARVLGLESLGGRLALSNLEGRLAVVDELDAAIIAKTSNADDWQLSEALQAAGVCASPVENVADLVNRDPMRQGFFQEIQHPVGVSMLLQHEPITWNGERLPIQRAPFLGEHSESVYRDLLGLSQDDLAELAAEGVIS
jgi:crotonobetainyl-CoA:carnitine CoA-transferase CaiB-like acyl-CoA transferase